MHQPEAPATGFCGVWPCVPRPSRSSAPCPREIASYWENSGALYPNGVRILGSGDTLATIFVLFAYFMLLLRSPPISAASGAEGERVAREAEASQ